MDKTHHQTSWVFDKNASRRKPEGKHQVYQVKTLRVSKSPPQ